jgi:hypothetical protein
MPKDHPGKKSSEKSKTKDKGVKDTLCAVSEHSLSGFLDNEPDIYTVADLKVRFALPMNAMPL